MALDSTSTLDDMKAAYHDSASYEIDGDLGKARLFVQACRMLLVELPASISKGGESVSLSIAEVAKEMNTARRWIASRSTSRARTRRIEAGTEFRR